jgi:hypothetical protein
MRAHRALRLSLRAALRTAVAMLCGSLLCALVPAPASGLAPLTTGFTGLPDPVGSSGLQWLRLAVGEQAGFVRLSVGWSSLAPATRPPGFNPADPSSPGYNFSSSDQLLKAYAGSGLNVILTITSAPRWAEGPHIPRGTNPGSWRPSASQFGSFATAIAIRYGGHFPDPAAPGTNLPRVSYWQAWNEPNLSFYLAPQWVRSGRRWAAASPGILRALENSFYSAVKRADPSNFVVLAGTAPYGDLPGGQRTQPVAFYRSLFCLQGPVALRPSPCQPTYLDALDHHPYGTGAPLQPAYNPDDVAIPDTYKIARVLHAAERHGRVLPHGGKPIWVTEYSWDSKPPDPQAVPIQTHARWLEQAMYVLWQQGVDTVFWLQIVDQAPIPNYAASYQAGLYFLNGKPKPAATAYRFPFVTSRLARDSVRAWGRSPAAGSLQIELRSGSRWRTVRALPVGARQVFEVSLPLSGRHTLRAQVAGQTSLTWNQAG